LCSQLFRKALHEIHWHDPDFLLGEKSLDELMPGVIACRLDLRDCGNLRQRIAGVNAFGGVGLGPWPARYRAAGKPNE
jgi:hypothetical protein